MHIEITNKYDCCGCTACASVCAKDAIIMRADDLGFKYPQVDKNTCVECGRCIDVCQFTKGYERIHYFSEPIIYGVRCVIEKELEKSQSGAGFFSISEVFLENGGVVYGAIARPFIVKHEKAKNATERDNMRGSKYIQSDLSGIFRDIQDELVSGKLVLFIGTPCQVTGLKLFIGERCNKNLYTIDLLCHGVGSPRIWDDYLCYLEKKYNGKIKYVNFRDKRFGWKNPVESYVVGERYVTGTTFLDLYFSHNILRDCCSICPYTNYNRIGDISLGDFWGWEKSHTEFQDNKGISLLFVNSKKGKILFDKAKNKLNYIVSNKEECKQQVLQYPTKHSENRKRFLEEYQRRGFTYVVKKYTQEGCKLRWKIKLARFLHYAVWQK